jgi:hypothetical protein
LATRGVGDSGIFSSGILIECITDFCRAVHAFFTAFLTD